MTVGFVQLDGLSPWWFLALAAILALLTGIYFKLTRMPWFRSHRLTVCIVLSVLAHVVLITGAYMAKLFELPTMVGDGAIRVTWEDAYEPQPGETTTEPLPIADVQRDSEAVPPSEVVPDESVDDAPLESFTIPADPIPAPAPPLAPPLWDAPAPAFAEPSPPVADESLTQRTELPADDENEFQPPEAMEPLVTDDAEALAGARLPKPNYAPPQTTSTLAEVPAEAQPPVTEPIPQDVTASQPDTDAQWRKVAGATNDTSPRDLVPVARRWQHDHSPSVPDPYRLRVAAERLPEILKRGGDADTEAAVSAALKWLADNQEPDGRWDASRHQAGQERAVAGHVRNGAGREADTGITGLALLVFLADGNTHAAGDYPGNVARGLEYLMSQQRDDGCLAGGARTYARMYCHGIATLALSEALAMTADERIRPFVERAVRYTLRSQHSVIGGWRYKPGQPGDTSQFGWQVMALMSAEQAGISIPASDRRLLENFLKTVSSGYAGGLAAYRPGRPPTRAMTAEAMVCRMFLRPGANRQRLTEGADFVMSSPPSSGPVNLYYWYYGSLALYQYGGHHWETWNEALKKRLLPRQRSRGAVAGSWDPNCVWGGHGGRVYSTAMAALCLEVYYRYLPLLSRQVAKRPYP